jgi:hypothetical protein
VSLIVRAIALVTVFGLAACGDSTPPGPPTAPTPAPPQPVTLVRTDLTPGEVSVTGTGQSVRLFVAAVFSDGTTRDISSEVRWQIDKPDVVSIDGGMLTVRGYGTTRFSSEYQGKLVGPGYAFVKVPDELLQPLTGVVRDQHGRAVPGAQIVGTGAVMMGTTTDANGVFDLGTTYGPAPLRLTKYGHRTTDITLQVAGAPVHAQLALPENPSPYAERTFEGTGQGPWQMHRLEARAGGPLDVLVESPNCSYRHTVGVLTVRLRGGGALLDDEIVGCGARVRTEAMPGDEARLEVAISTPGTYRVTYRTPR